ncbi:glycoside hydrolase family 2 TIM barrel-domain containing protein [Spirosoma pomorum]
MRVVHFFLFFPFTWLFESCLQDRTADYSVYDRAKPTSIYHNGQAYKLLRYGKPYFIQGAGGKSHLKRLKQSGGNSVRTWDDIDGEQLLNQAQQLDLTVLFGLWVEREADGFDYNDQQAVDRQYERIRKTVLKYKDHPALLMWCVGNEWSQDATNFDVFDEVNRLIELVHELDPNHPVTTAISPDSERSIWLVRERCPALDILSVNSYGLMPELAGYLQKGGWNKPYLISEFGAKGYWEETTTLWDTPIEPNSTQKSKFISQTYRQYITSQPGGGSRPQNCFGSYVFYWGQKQEETHTWFSLFDEKGRESPQVALMQQLWTGQTPANTAPVIQKMIVDGSDALSQVFSKSAGRHSAYIMAIDPDDDTLSYRWEIKLAAKNTSDYINTVRPAISGLIRSTNGPFVDFVLPSQPDAYRLFVYVYDTHNHFSTMNIPFRITANGMAE